MTLFSVYNRLPPRLRNAIKRALGTSGHSRSFFDRIIAKRDAKGKKSLLASLAQVSRLVAYASPTGLYGKRVADFGCGYVPTDAVAMWLLGAEESIAVDYNSIADFSALRAALYGDDALVRAPTLLKLPDPGLFGERSTILRGLPEISESSLREVGIQYLAPYDLATTPLSPALDLVLSTSVLEHLPPKEAPIILQNLCRSLSPHGIMVHEIHLEDHYDFRHNPLAFLKKGTDYNALTDFDARGNRLREADWLSIFDRISNYNTETVERRSREGGVPDSPSLLPEFSALTREELLVSHVVIRTAR